MTLLTILICLFASLAILVKVAERFGRPLEPAESQRLSRIIIILVGLLLLSSSIKFLMS